MMSTAQRPAVEPDILYPDSDGELMADNTLQFEWITTIKGGLDALFQERDNVFVAGDLLWYPVRGRPDIRRAPDAMVAFGRPKGYRGSYKQWEEADIAPHVVFEVLSPNNTPREMRDKLRFYEMYGVEEYYLYDPEGGTFDGWLRSEHRLQPIAAIAGWTSPRLGVRFELDQADLLILRPDGSRFLSYVELARQRDLEQQARQQAEHARQLEQQARQQAETRAERMAAKLRALGIDPDTLDA
ncbi:MAG: Uma2 family endonuclease [Chloroflexaceae bacterium]|nr:Uma2 family endonuclease [Chloroflexaceae bacterium]NJO05464.1 Uma2 family endonuclease [Chloroflexaceae bacterium]